MSQTIFPTAGQAVTAIQGTDATFPVRRIFCVGRNYAAHRREMGGDDREPPFFFSKPADAVVRSGATVAYPLATADLQHEVELVVAIGRGGQQISAGTALSHVFGYAVGVDLTRRDLQTVAKGKGQPWDAGKAFDQSAPIGAITPCTDRAWTGRIQLDVNGARRQSANLADMIWTLPEIIAECSRLWRLCPGDLIFTGTPEGVSPLFPGDVVRASIDGLDDLSFAIG